MTLIERLEAASGPDRELDAEIAPIIGLRIVDEGHPIGRVCHDANNYGVRLPRYTASIDAALTLVPVQNGPWGGGRLSSRANRSKPTAMWSATGGS